MWNTTPLFVLDGEYYKKIFYFIDIIFSIIHVNSGMFKKGTTSHNSIVTPVCNYLRNKNGKQCIIA